MVAETKTRQVMVQADGSVRIPAEVLERAGIKAGDEVYFWTTGRGDLNGDLIPDLTLDEMIERFGAKEPVEFDWPTLREEAEEGVAREVVPEMN